MIKGNKYNINIRCSDPKIFIIDNFITENECNHLINIGKSDLMNSVVSDNSGGFISKGRTSKTSWIDLDKDNITNEISKNISDLVNIPIENSEKFQLVYYNINNEYKQHYDSWDHNGSEKTLRCIKYGGPRILTALLYLNNVEEGGTTYFTKLDIDIKPEKGRLLIFENVYKNSINKHLLSEHTGKQVIKGEKYIVNLWFRQFNRSKLYSETNPDYYNNIKGLNIQKKMNKKYFLEEGDFFPLIELTNKFRTIKMHNFVNSNEFIIIQVNNINLIDWTELILLGNINYIIFFNIGQPNSNIKNICFDNNKYNLLDLNIKNNNIKVYFLNPNRKIYEIIILNNISEINNIKPKKSIKNYNIPYLLIENVLSNELTEKILNFYENNNNKLIAHVTPTKNRCHIHPDKELEIEIDNKLSRSVFPEIKKIYYFDVKYRELYKICSYNSESNGKFHAHRDTPHPYQHRKYAMSLFLNDDYTGGEFELPEYNLKIKPEKNSAIIFPGICSHKVNTILSGKRKVIITFFCSEIEGKTKNNNNYKVKSDFFKENNIKYSDIYPI